MSETGKSQKRLSQESALNSKIVEWIDRLSTHFNQPQDEEQIKIFLYALRNNTVYQVDVGFERCLNECTFMPKLSEVHARMPEQRYPTENPGRFVLRQPPILDVIRPIAEEICPKLTGRSYAEIRSVCGEDSARGDEATKLVHEVFAAANRERYRRMGIDPDEWAGRKAKKAGA